MDVAKKAGVSMTSVSLVLNEKPNSIADETKKRIFKAAKDLDYHPNYFARSLKTQKSNIIGVLLPTLTNPFFAEYASQLNYYAKKKGYNLLINEYQGNSTNVQDALGDFLTYNIAGIIIIQFNLDEQMILEIEKRQIPFVISDSIDNQMSNKYSTVIIDNYEGATLATEHLIQKGHEVIGCYTGPLELDSTKVRLAAYKDTLKKYNIDNFFCFEGTYEIGNEDKALQYFMENNCTAIFSLNDIMALGLYKVARQKQVSIPNDLSIIGFDNIPSSELVYPELTTIEQSLDVISKSAVNTLVNSIDHPDYTKKTIIQPKLIERMSVLDRTIIEEH